MVVPLGSPQPVFSYPQLDEILDTADDVPESGTPITAIGPLQISSIVFGAAAFSHFYSPDQVLTTDIPVRTIRLALRYGIGTFDTSTYYGPSEIVLGAALQSLQNQYPRASYKLITKCGRYGPTKADFDYSPSTIRASVHRSLSRLHTTYLDTVYLHDIEFVCSEVQPRKDGNHSAALSTEKAEYGLQEGEEGKIWGAGDRIILEAVAELRKMKSEGLIKNIGITGYPLPVLLRIALLVLHTAPYEPLDMVLSYSHLNLQNDTVAAFLPQFQERARVSQFVTASPLNMGLLTSSPPTWHPAGANVREASQRANEVCTREKWTGGLPNIALGFAYREAGLLNIPSVVGLCNLEEVHETVAVWRELQAGDDQTSRKSIEQQVLHEFEDVQGYSWASP